MCPGSHRGPGGAQMRTQGCPLPDPSPGAARSSGWAPVPGGRPEGLTCSLLFLRRRLLCSRSLSLTELSTCSRRATALSWPKTLPSRSFFSCSRVSCCLRRVLSARAACGRQGFHGPRSRAGQDEAWNQCQGHTCAVTAARTPCLGAGFWGGGERQRKQAHGNPEF